MMNNTAAAAVDWVEQGLVPDRVVRLGIRRLLKARLTELAPDDAAGSAEITARFVAEMRTSPLALLTEKANEQHYEVPAGFFVSVLGPHRKYSGCWWPEGVDTLDDAEAAALQTSCERAGIAQGQRILELGCGWGSLTLWMAERYPGSRITALSNSHSQRLFIEEQASQRGLSNITVVTCDINHFDTDERFDRIVSIEMFEHLRNWADAFGRVNRWLAPGGRFFMHVFANRSAPYAFVERDASDWMSRHFFSGGMMPSDDLALHFQDDLRLLQRWRWDGRHYARTAEAWLKRMDSQRERAMPVFEQVYGSHASVWWMRWRLFFMSCAELFAYDGGQQWWVSHYLFERRA